MKNVIPMFKINLPDEFKFKLTDKILNDTPLLKI